MFCVLNANANLIFEIKPANCCFNLIFDEQSNMIWLLMLDCFWFALFG